MLFSPYRPNRLTQPEAVRMKLVGELSVVTHFPTTLALHNFVHICHLSLCNYLTFAHSNNKESEFTHLGNVTRIYLRILDRLPEASVRFPALPEKKE
jgi:hypothetical protein